MKSLKETIDSIHSRHSEYIEATYHVKHPRLIRERKRLLYQPGNIATLPWIEATPAYKTGKRIESMSLPPQVRSLLLKYYKEGLVYNPLYAHQVEALCEFFNKKKDLVVSTGTGSGKTEIFLYSILGMLALEGFRKRTQHLRGMRALILYPMNALVSDQLSRLRKTIGDGKVAGVLGKAFGRTVQFGMYTSRTPYHGVYGPDKNEKRVKPVIKYFTELASNPKKAMLFKELNDRGRIPAKNLQDFMSGPRELRYKTHRGDRELFTRQEMHSPNEYGGTPDILITNYSMLEYMLLRPIEQSFFETTSQWLASDPENQLILVIDEAHLYRGAQGAEVAMLIRRLIQRLGVSRDKIRCILTSASLGDPKSAMKNGKNFASRLTAGEEKDFSIILGLRKELGGKPPLPSTLGKALQSVSSDLAPSSLRDLSIYFGWDTPIPNNQDDLRLFLGLKLKDTPEFKALHDVLARKPITVGNAGKILFPDMETKEQITAVLNFSLIATAARLSSGSPGKSVDPRPLLPVRLHLMYRGLPKQYACVNPTCDGREIKDGPHLLGAMFLAPMLSCPHCGSRVFELLTHRTCGAAYLKAYVKRESIRYPIFLWSSDEFGDLQEVHLLMDEPRNDPDPSGSGVPLNDRIAPRYIDKRTGYLLDSKPSSDSSSYVRCWWPPDEGQSPTVSKKKKKNPRPDVAWSWPRCYACGIPERKWKGLTKIMDLETKGEDPFANIVKTLFHVQPSAKSTSKGLAKKLPNEGRKVLCFSDGRQKAARLARDIQRTVEQDSFREFLVLAAANAGENAPLDTLFANMVIITKKHNICLFDDGEEGYADYEGSRSMFLAAQNDISRIMKDFELRNEEELLKDKWARKELDGKKPRQYNQNLLRALGDRNFSVRSTLIGYVAPLKSTLTTIQALNKDLKPDIVSSILMATIENALKRRALDSKINEKDRRLSRKSIAMPQGYSESGGEGLTPDNLIPKSVRNALKESPFGLSEDQFSKLSASMRRGGQEGEEPLFVTENGRLWLNPSAVILKVAISENWMYCQGCGQFSPYSYDGRCPDFKCQGKMVPLLHDDLYVETRKKYFRRPVQEMLKNRRKPFTLRSEEHTAQLTKKDASMVFGRAERYELLFQDVLVDDLEAEQPVDILSCTTTMEVGIDIGSLTAVALRTVPPRPDNYQQRSGRAGRRGTALSTIVTFADNSPYETFIFQNPARIIGADSGTPSIYVQNAKIAERHINASLIQAFFQRNTGKTRFSLEDEAKKWNVFESLGTGQFFFTEKSPYSFEEFKKWIDVEIKRNSSSLTDRLGRLLPRELADSLKYGSDDDWRRRFIVETGKQFVEDLKKIQDRGMWERNADLLSNLLDASLLPTFSFPIDTCQFVVRDIDRKTKRVINRYEMTQDLNRALSDYVPGREIVVDKHTFISYGLFFPFTNDYPNRARIVKWDELPWLNFCRMCGSIVDNDKEPLSAEEEECKVCNSSTIESMPKFRPEGFAPRVNQISGACEGGEEESKRVYATRANYPVPVIPTPPPGIAVANISDVSEIRSLPNQKLLVANYGPDNKGFAVCINCGAVSLTGMLQRPHDRPYQIEDWRMRGQKPQCSGASVQVAFTSEFQTDLAILRVTMRSPLKSAFYEKWFQGIAMSLSEALAIGATRVLNIDSSEIASNWRVVSRYKGDKPGINGHLEFFLYDTTPGGAGFAAAAAVNFPKIIKEAKYLLENCNCGTSCHKCIRTYNNRIYHETLNRIDALSLLEYILSGDVPLLPIERADRLLVTLATALRLCDSSVAISKKAKGQMHIVRNKRLLEITVRSTLREEITSLMSKRVDKKKGGSSPLRLKFTDYEILHRLPYVVGQILDSSAPQHAT